MEKSKKRLRIGISACFFHPDPKRPIFKGKTLLYLEESLASWIGSEGAFTYLIPRVSPALLKDLAKDIDALVLQGGSDVSPKSYRQSPLKPEWEGDYARDQYEIGLIHAFIDMKKPILGICRGAQIINVALGGTLYQDIHTGLEGGIIHRDWESYDRLTHDLKILPGTALSRLYPGMTAARVNSVHHQGIRDLGKDLLIEARSPKDGVIEAVRLNASSYLFAVQWHPEYQNDHDLSLLDRKPILHEFLGEAYARRR